MEDNKHQLLTADTLHWTLFSYIEKCLVTLNLSCLIAQVGECCHVPEIHGGGVSKNRRVRQNWGYKTNRYRYVGVPCCYTRIMRMHHGPYSTKNSEYKNDCSCPIQSHILFISYPSWQSKKSVSKQHKSETSFASFVEIRRNFSVLKHFFDLTRMQTVLAFMAVETKANILWYSIHILEQNQTIAEPPGDKHFSSILFPSTCQSVYWECLTSIFHFFF